VLEDLVGFAGRGVRALLCFLPRTGSLGAHSAELLGGVLLVNAFENAFANAPIGMDRLADPGRRASLRGALILLVNAERIAVRRIDALLSDEGYLVATASSFEQGNAFFSWVSPDLLVADIRLGAFNGLHLATLARFDHSSLPIIITDATQDVVLEHEATRLGATFVVNPLDNAAFLPLVRSVLEEHRGTQPLIRRWPRKRVSEIVEARAASALARVVEVSYGGLRLAFEGEPADVLTSFDVNLPAAEITLSAHRVWMGPGRERDAYCCGVELADTGTSVSGQWRAFVDSVN
jgi:DNA-binding response OmpR family regulator